MSTGKAVRVSGLCPEAAGSVKTSAVIGKPTITPIRVKKGQDSSSRICNHCRIPRSPREPKERAEARVDVARQRPGGANKPGVAAENCEIPRQGGLAKLSTVGHCRDRKGVPLLTRAMHSTFAPF